MRAEVQGHVTAELVHACVISYRNFLLCDHNNAVGTPDPDRCQATLRDGFKGIFCKKDIFKNE